MTCYYAQQTAADVMTPGRIPEWTRFVPQYLKPAGYRTYHSGKWHIRFRPVAGAGFHRSYLLQDQNRTFTPTAHFLDDEPLTQPKISDGYYASTAIATMRSGVSRSMRKSTRARRSFITWPSRLRIFHCTHPSRISKSTTAGLRRAGTRYGNGVMRG